MPEARAAICFAPHEPLRVETVTIAPPREGHVLVKFKSAGLCHSDLNVFEGKSPRVFPIIQGHEGAGIVIECGAGVRGLKPGDHVIPSALPECRECDYCTSGRTNWCRQYEGRSAADTHFSFQGRPVTAGGGLGTFCEMAVASETALAKIRDDAPLDVVSYLACGVVTGVGSVIATAKVQPGAKVVVFGLGGVGLNVLQGARLAGAVQIVGVDTNPAKAETAKAFGMTDFVNPKDVNGDLAGHLKEVTGGGGDYAFECIGHPDLMKTALECTHIGWGVAVLVGVAPAGSIMCVNPFEMLRGRRVIGTLLGGMKPRTFLPTLVDWYMDGKIMVDELITHRIGLDDINYGFDLMKRGESIRTVIEYR